MYMYYAYTCVHVVYSCVHVIIHGVHCTVNYTEYMYVNEISPYSNSNYTLTSTPITVKTTVKLL